MIHVSCIIAPSATIIGNVRLDYDVSIWPGAVLRGDDGPIRVRGSTNIQDNSTVHATSRNPCVIGMGVTIGHNAVVHGCRILDECLIGIGSTILDGAEIGSHSIIGAASLVLENQTIAPGSLVIGVPGRVVRGVTTSERKMIRDSWTHYVRLAKSHSWKRV